MADSPDELRGQPLLPNDRAQGAWLGFLTGIMGARSKVDARAHYQQARGYMAALNDVDLIDPVDLKLMGTTTLCALNDALARLQAAGDGS
jgi:hypothetical protein